MKLFLKSADKKLFDNYRQHAIDGDLSNQDAIVKIFNPYGKGTWYIINSDPDDPNYLWGIAVLDEVEIGSISRSELENLKMGKFQLGLERDTSFSPIRAEKLYKMLKEDRYKDWEDDPAPAKVEPSTPKLKEASEADKVFKQLMTKARTLHSKAEEDGNYYPNPSGVGEDAIKEIKEGIALCLENGVPAKLIIRMATGTMPKLKFQQNNESSYGNVIFMLRTDSIKPRFVLLTKQWMENYYESGFKYLDFDINDFKALGYNNKVTKTFQGELPTGEKYEQTFDMWIHDDGTTVVSFTKDRTGDGGYSNLYAEGIDNGYKKTLELLKIATYVKEVDYYENGYGSVDENEALSVLKENAQKFPTRFDAPAQMSVVRDDDEGQKVFQDTTDKLMKKLRERIKNRKYEYNPKPEAMSEIRKGIELCQREGVFIDWVYKFVLGTKITTEGEKEGLYVPQLYTFRIDYILKQFEKFIDLFKSNMFVAGWKYPEIDANGLQKLGFKTRGIKEETLMNPYTKKESVSKAEVWITDDYRHIYTITGSYAGLVSTDLERGYAMAVELTKAMSYVKDVDYFMNGLGGMSFEGSLNTLQEAMEKRMKEIKEQMKMVDPNKFASGGVTDYSNMDIDSVIDDLNKATMEVRSDAPKFALDHIDSKIDMIEKSSKFQKPNKLAQGDELQDLPDAGINLFEKGGQVPDWLFVASYPTGIFYFDKRKEKSGEYHKIGYISYRDLSIKMYDNSQKYKKIKKLMEKRVAKIKKDGKVSISVTQDWHYEFDKDGNVIQPKYSYQDGGEIKYLNPDDIDWIVRHYVTAGLWASTDWDTDEPLDENYSYEDVNVSSLLEIREGVEKFLKENAEIIERQEIPKDSLGHDMFLTSRGHGAGFWDRGYGDDGETLSESAKKIFTSDSPYVGDDGQLYFKKGGTVDWAQKAEKKMEKNDTVGAFTKQAENAGMDTTAFAKKVLANPKDYNKKTRQRAQFMKNLNPELFEAGGEIAKIDAKRDKLRKKAKELQEAHNEKYAGIDISEPMSQAEKDSQREIAKVWSEINRLVREKNKLKKLEQGGDIQDLAIANSDLFEDGGNVRTGILKGKLPKGVTAETIEAEWTSSGTPSKGVSYGGLLTFKDNKGKIVFSKFFPVVYRSASQVEKSIYKYLKSIKIEDYKERIDQNDAFYTMIDRNGRWGVSDDLPDARTLKKQVDEIRKTKFKDGGETSSRTGTGYGCAVVLKPTKNDPTTTWLVAEDGHTAQSAGRTCADLNRQNRHLGARRVKFANQPKDVEIIFVDHSPLSDEDKADLKLHWAKLSEKLRKNDEPFGIAKRRAEIKRKELRLREAINIVTE